MGRPLTERGRKLRRIVEILMDRGMLEPKTRTGMRKKLADHFGVSQSAIWRTIEQVKAERQRSNHE